MATEPTSFSCGACIKSTTTPASMKGQVKTISGENGGTFRVHGPAGIGHRQDCLKFALLVTAPLPPSTMLSRGRLQWVSSDCWVPLLRPVPWTASTLKTGDRGTGSFAVSSDQGSACKHPWLGYEVVACARLARLASLGSLGLEDMLARTNHAGSTEATMIQRARSSIRNDPAVFKRPLSRATFGRKAKPQDTAKIVFT